MQLSALRVFDTPSVRTVNRAVQIGHAAKLRLMYGSYESGSYPYWHQIVDRAISQHRIKFYSDSAGEIVGYVVWAMLDAEVGERVEAQGKFVLHKSEWNEGEQLWIVDLLIRPGYGRRVWQDVAQMFRQSGQLSYIRMRGAGAKPQVRRCRL